MTPVQILPRQRIVQRLHAMIPLHRGRPRLNDTTLKIHDVAVFIGVSGHTLEAVARSRREMDDALQVQLSSFFALWDAQGIIKRFDGHRCLLERRRVTPSPGALQPSATIDPCTFGLRVDWG